MARDYQPPSQQVLRWVEESLNGRVLAASRLLGGLTADMDRLTVAMRSGTTIDVVLRRWWDAGGSGLVRREAAGLAALVGHDVPAPRLLATDPAGAAPGVPCLLMSALPGEPMLAPPDMAACVRAMAATLARIHAVPARLERTDPHKLRDDADLGWIGDERLKQTALSAADEALGLPADVLVHGDYQQLNILWHDGQLSGVVDWTYAGLGRREIDVGHCRLALAVLFSSTVADDFLRCYEAEVGRRVDPRGDIRALLTFGPLWTSFVPRQVAGRAPVDTDGMASRVADVLRGAIARLG